MDLINMKSAKRSNSAEVADSAPEYPYGLSLHLDEESLAKLGMDDLPEVGATLMVTAKAVVTSVSASEHAEGDKHKSATLQITDMAVGDVPKEKDARSLYPNSHHAA